MVYLSLIKRDGSDQATGRAQYRVIETEAVDENILFHHGIYKRAFFIKKQLFIRTNKPYRQGNLINPRKALGI